uniref:AlNc14C41G3502 protein n=1 Tax=Albugo laibachii Nc14 TaxID=890382 RepID=F0W9P7_9STRA|nr:AlNc14C41G3502 [Albugo laibachii Nc14]|eukprot:CCA17865.1 AlNc14C41G3502 [Albugo laibachii Nc14]
MNAGRMSEKSNHERTADFQHRHEGEAKEDFVSGRQEANDIVTEAQDVQSGLDIVRKRFNLERSATLADEEDDPAGY